MERKVLLVAGQPEGEPVSVAVGATHELVERVAFAGYRPGDHGCEVVG